MFGKMLKGMFGADNATVGGAPSAPRMFEFLELVHFGLADRAEAYLMTGEDEAIVAELAALNIPHPRMEREEQKALAELPFKMRGEPERLARYVRLRHAMKWGIARPYRTESHLENVPDLVRVCFGLANWNRWSQDRDKETQTDDVVAAAKLLGATDVNIIAHGFPTRGRGTFPIPETYWETVDPADYFKALELCDTKNRALFIEKQMTLPIMKSPAIASYLFDQFEATSSKLRDAARATLESIGADLVEPTAIELLQDSKAQVRTATVQLLGNLGTATALDALKARRDVEKTQSVQAAMDAFLNTSSAAVDLGEDGGYIDVHGNHVPLPTHEAPLDDGTCQLDEAVYKRLKEIEDQVHADADESFRRRMEYWKSGKARFNEEPKPEEKKPIAKIWFNALNTPVEPGSIRQLTHFGYRYEQQANAIIDSALAEIPLRRVIDLATWNGSDSIVRLYSSGVSRFVQQEIRNGSVSLSQVFEAVDANRLATFDEDVDISDFEPSSLKYLERYLGTKNRGSGVLLFPGIWEAAASRLQDLIEALPPRDTNIHLNLRALRIAADFPTLPQALLPSVLFCAIDARPKLNKPAQELLLDVDGIDDELIALLKDKRQAVRANAARFLADRGSAAAVPALAKRLKTEKSELAKADMISAISRLGGDTGPYLGKDALMKEAQTLVGKLPNEKIKWLDLSSAPALHWADDGSMADPILIDAWLRLALKLKSPLGSPLFGLYLEQMTPDSAQAFADWVLDAWMSYDVAKPSPDELRAKAMEQAKNISNSQSHWARNRSLDDIVEMLMSGMSKDYLNSGADSKGILALTHRATPNQAGPRIAAHLKKHGKRVNQAKALVEALFAMGTRDAIQVLVATATRFRQRTVRELAEKLVGELAEARGWTEDELADRSIPSGGFEEDGTLPLPVGEDEKAYVARLDSDLTVRLFNPAGKEVKSIPAGKDENTKESKALLSAAKKSVKAAAEQQAARLYEAMLTPRSWEKDAWQDDLATHPIMRRLVERLIWRGLDVDGAALTTFRITAEGDVMNADGDDVDLSDIARIDMAHTANLDEDAREAWLQHLKDFEVKALFPQVSRPLHKLTDELLSSTKLEDRQGWLMTHYKLRSAVKKCGYERGPIGDGGGYNTYRKEFRGAGLNADLHFTGSYMGAEDFDTAIDSMQFTRIGEGNHYHAQPVALKQVPPLLLSEVWNDLHEIAKSGAYDPEWKKKGLY